MTKTARSLLLALALPLCVPLASPIAIGEDATVLATPMKDQPLAVNALLGTIEGEPLFAEDVFRPIDEDIRRLARVSGTLSEFKMQVRDSIQKQLKQLVSDTLILKAARDNLTEEDTHRVEAYMNKIRNDLLTKHGGSAALADQYFKTRGSNLAKEVADLRRRTTVDLYMMRTLGGRISVTRQNMLDRYNKNLGKYTQEGEVDLYTITLPISRWLPKGPDEKPVASPTPAQVDAARGQAVARAKELIAQIRKGMDADDFAKLVQDNSVDPKRNQQGRWKKTHKGDLLSKDVEGLAFTLAPDAVAESPVIVNGTDAEQGVVVIVKVGETKPARVTPFVEVQKAIEKEIREQQYMAISRDYYNKLFEKAAIEAVESMVDTATSVAVTRYAVK